MTATTDRRDFVRAIIDNPECDTTRLVYADYLTESGDGDRGEFVRAQCSPFRSWITACLAGYCRDAAEFGGRYAREQRRCLDRTDALLAAHPEWVPTCPRCRGTGYEGHVGPRSHGCANCRGWEGAPGSGRCPHSFERGLLAVRCRLADVMTDRVTCKCVLTFGGKGSPWLRCPTCHGTGTVPGDWHPTDWGLALRGYDVEAVELVDWERYTRGSSGGGVWFADDVVYDHDALPKCVCPMAEYPTPDDARRALALAVARWLWRWEPPASPLP